MKYIIEPSIGNHNETFLTKWYRIQEDCSIKLMELTHELCDEKLHEANIAATNLEKALKQNTWNEKFVKLQGEICAQKRQSKSRLQRKKNKET